MSTKGKSSSRLRKHSKRNNTDDQHEKSAAAIARDIADTAITIGPASQNAQKIRISNDSFSNPVEEEENAAYMALADDVAKNRAFFVRGNIEEKRSKSRKRQAEHQVVEIDSDDTESSGQLGHDDDLLGNQPDQSPPPRGNAKKVRKTIHRVLTKTSALRNNDDDTSIELVLDKSNTKKHDDANDEHSDVSSAQDSNPNFVVSDRLKKALQETANPGARFAMPNTRGSIPEPPRIMSVMNQPKTLVVGKPKPDEDMKRAIQLLQSQVAVLQDTQMEDYGTVVDVQRLQSKVSELTAETRSLKKLIYKMNRLIKETRHVIEADQKAKK